MPTIEFNPDPDFVGIDTFEYEIRNPDGSTDRGTVTVVVGEQAPEIGGQPITVIRAPEPGELIEPAYRFLASDLATGRIVAEVPATAASWVEALNGAGGVTMTLPLMSVTPTDIGRWRTALWIERHGELLAGGIVQAATPNVEAETVTFTAPGFRSYLTKRRHTGTYSQVDQTTIAAYIVGTAALPSINVPPQQPSGVLRDRSWPEWQGQYCGELLANLEQLIDGFDSWFLPEWADGYPSVRFETRYPATGRPTLFTFEQSVNCDVHPEYDGTETADTVHGIGAGEGPDTLQRTVTAVNRDGRPILEADIVRTDITVGDTLAGHANRELQRRRQPIDRINLHIYPGSRPTLGSYRTGDRVRVVADVGYIQIDATCRITHIAGEITDGDEKVVVTVTPLEVYQ